MVNTKLEELGKDVRINKNLTYVPCKIANEKATIVQHHESFLDISLDDRGISLHSMGEGLFNEVYEGRKFLFFVKASPSSRMNRALYFVSDSKGKKMKDFVAQI